jgi:hypothetical protein
MVQQVDFQELAGLVNVAGDGDILGSGGRVAGGMIVGHNQGRGIDLVAEPVE